ALGVCKTGAEEAGVTEVRTSLSEKKFELWREDRKSGSAGMPRPISYAVFCLKKKIFVLFFIASCAVAQDANSALRPPNGSQLSLVVFEDLQCPQCRRAAPLVEQAAKTYKIPVVRHDFPLPLHNWSFQAAVMAHYFDSHSKQLGNDFRDYIFQHQLEINPGNLR